MIQLHAVVYGQLSIEIVVNLTSSQIVWSLMSDDPKTMTPEQYLKLSKKVSNNCKRSSDVPHVPESYPQEMRCILEKLKTPELPEDLKPQKEWTSNLIRWFAHVRQNYVSAETDSVPSWTSVVRDIESQELPFISRINSQENASAILIYFEKKVGVLTKTDLHWIFGSLTVIDRLLTQEMCVTIQNVKSKLTKQIQAAQRTDELVSYIVVIVTLISKYFGQ